METVFKCNDCAMNFKYEDKQAHGQQCEEVKYTCMCNQSFKRAQLVVHWNQYCLEATVACEMCCAEMERGEIHNHKCIASLTQKLELANEKITQQQNQIETQ
jgi:hypothetical protein